MELMATQPADHSAGSSAANSAAGDDAAGGRGAGGRAADTAAKRPVPQPVHLGADVHLIDTAMSGYDGITAAYAILGDRPALIETGTATSAPVVRAALAQLGVGAEDLATIVVTHIHLDHAGGVGTLAAAFPKARVVVQDIGARHLADPSRLMYSARRVFGPAMDELFGELLPTEAARIDAIGTVGRVDLGGGRHLEAHHTPGHAYHHLGLVDSATGDLYVGDAAGIYIPPADARAESGLSPDGGSGTLLPGTPPPDFDLDLALDSLDRFRDLASTRLLFSHYGPIIDVGSTLERAKEELRVWVDLVRTARTSQREAAPGAAFDLDHAVAMVRDRTRERYATLLARPEIAAKFEELSSTGANVAGIARWLDQLDRLNEPVRG